MKKEYIFVILIIFINVSGNIVFNEVMSNVKGNESGTGAPGDRNEFVELYNLSDTTVNILKYHLSDGEASDYFDMYADSLIYPGGIINDSMVPPHKYIVILDKEYSYVGDSVYFMPYDIPSDAYVFTIENTTFGSSGLSSNDFLFFYDENDSIVDVFGTPDIEDGFPYDPGDGVSIEKINYYYPDSPSSYSSCIDAAGNSTGKVNSVFIEGAVIDSISAKRSSVECSLFVFLNYLDGFNDKLIIQYEDEEETIIIDTNVIMKVTENTKRVIANIWTESSSIKQTILLKNEYNPGTVVLNEFMVQGDEWIEIYNPHQIPFYLAGSKIINSNDTLAFISGMIDADDYMIVSVDTSEVKSNYYDLNLNLMECDLFALPDREDTIVMLKEGSIMDSVIRGYENNNSSIERISSKISGFKKENWDNCIDFIGATPCLKNSINGDDLSFEDSIFIYPQIITSSSPNLYLQLSLSEHKGEVSVKIYDELGAMIEQPIKERLVSSEETVMIKNIKSRLKNGLYIVFVEIETPLQKIRKTFNFAVRNN